MQEPVAERGLNDAGVDWALLPGGSIGPSPDPLSPRQARV
jgi:hypothetical protein